MGSEDLNPFENAECWDYISVNGKTSPGLLTAMSGFKRDYGWDVKKGKGAKGSTVTLTTYPPVEGSCTFKLWTKEHFDQWALFRKNFEYDATKTPIAAMIVAHPSWSDIGFNSAVCKSLSAPIHEGKGLYSITLELIEYNPPPKKAASGTATGTNAKKKAGEAPILTELEKQIQKQREIASQPL